MSTSLRTLGGLTLVATLAALAPARLEANFVEATHRHRGTATIVGVDSPSSPYFLDFELGAWQGELSCTGFDIPNQFLLFSVDDVATVRDEHLLICEDAYQDVRTATGTLDSQGSWAIAEP